MPAEDERLGKGAGGQPILHMVDKLIKDQNTKIVQVSRLERTICSLLAQERHLRAGASDKRDLGVGLDGGLRHQ